MNRTRPVLLAAAALAWASASAGGLCLLASYDSRRGEVGDAPAHWPTESAIPFEGGRANLVMFVHPRCPCSRSAIAELEYVLARCEGPIATRVVFYRPDGSMPDWCRSPLWVEAAAIPGVLVNEDPGATEAARFGAATSGHVLLFDGAGLQLFSGGITQSRSHRGENEGRSAVIALVEGSTPMRARTPVFGCSLRSPSLTANVEAPR